MFVNTLKTTLSKKIGIEILISPGCPQDSFSIQKLGPKLIFEKYPPLFSTKIYVHFRRITMWIFLAKMKYLHVNLQILSIKRVSLAYIYFFKNSITGVPPYGKCITAICALVTYRKCVFLFLRHDFKTRNEHQ